MMEMLEGLKKLGAKYKSTGSQFAKKLAIELYLDQNHDGLIGAFAEALKDISPQQMPDLIRDKIALPIPEVFTHFLHGFQDYLETLEPGRIFEWISEAKPDIAEAIMAMEDEGIAYIIHLKQFIVASVCAAPADEESPDTEAPPSEDESTPVAKKTLTCSECNESWQATEEEAAQTQNCPFCSAPA